MRIALVISLSLHLLLYLLSRGTKPLDLAALRDPLASQMVEIVAPPPPPKAELVPAPELEPEPREELAPEPAPRPRPRRAKRVKKAAPPASAQPAGGEGKEDPAPVEEAVEFAGVTLTSDAPEAGWSSAVGSGADQPGPIGAPGGTAPSGTVRKARGRGRGRGGGVGDGRGMEVVPLASLAKKPGAPDLDRELERNYPAEAKRRGEEGDALVEAVIDGKGRVASMRVVRESSRGFGRACRRTLSGSRWKPGRDQQGRAVATIIRYRCEFISEGW